jgi:SulP family sulfate permease
MGASNFVAGITGAYPVNGSLSRSAVNYTAGAKTPISGVIVAGLMALTALFLTPILKALPLATLAALIIFACFSLLDFKSLWRTWVYSRADGITALATFLSVLVFGVQWGVLVGVILSMALHIRLTLQPNMVLVGRFPGTEHYRDADRFNVETHEEVKTLRIDESLYYANARYLEDMVAQIVSDSPRMRDLILMCPAVNRIDASALSSLEEVNKRLLSAGIRLHFSELH